MPILEHKQSLRRAIPIVPAHECAIAVSDVADLEHKGARGNIKHIEDERERGRTKPSESFLQGKSSEAERLDKASRTCRRFLFSEYERNPGQLLLQRRKRP